MDVVRAHLASRQFTEPDSVPLFELRGNPLPVAECYLGKLLCVAFLPAGKEFRGGVVQSA